MTFIKLGAGETAMHACWGAWRRGHSPWGPNGLQRRTLRTSCRVPPPDLVSLALGVLESAGRLLE